ncbi:MAG: hypothetical protein J0H27_14260 [Xanthomonadales bacterium]|nr:hypothetical protein [Xanthomonadales bacterium]ODU93074.1 MAG: hypothetical protein ABT18_09935 [Rhodanobacter sp. SCN 66-43]OJY83757.1 MAG: hypothetical protein BGP23_14075 [Xanthomonadales bacterium 66-474]
MTLKSKKLADQIAKLEAERRAAIEAEREADERELIRLVTAAHCLQDALGYARSKLAKRKSTGAQKPTTTQETQQ